MNIVFCTDTNYIMPSSVLIKSISLNNTEAMITFYAIIDESVTEKDKARLIDEIKNNNNHSITFLTVNGQDYEDMPNLDVSHDYAKQNKITATHTTKACYYRLSMASLLPQSVERVIYFDCDIVVTQNLTDLWKTDLEGKAVAAVVDEGEFQMRYDQLGFSPTYGYFNSGVMIINLSYWRKFNMIDKFLEIIKGHVGRMRQHDQEILNIAFYNNVKRLPIKYNFQENFFRKSEYIPLFYKKYSKEIEASINDIAVLHYTAEKPWYNECGQPHKNVFYTYLKETTWIGYTPRWKNKKYSVNISIFRLLVKLGIKKSIYRNIRP